MPPTGITAGKARGQVTAGRRTTWTCPPGQYALAISGGRDGAGHKVYGLRFDRVAQLPGLPGPHSDSFDFEIA